VDAKSHNRYGGVTVLKRGLMYIRSMRYATSDVHQQKSGHRLQITLTDRQYALLREEARRTSLSMAEIIRRCIDGVMRPHRRVRFRGYELNFTVAREVDAAVAARRISLNGGRGQAGGSRDRVSDAD
jgi:hypothetical protein